MISNDVEYRILKNGTGKLFKVEIKDGSFMGVGLWKPLKKVYISFCMFDIYYLTVTDIPGRTCYLSTYLTCKGAKHDAIKFSLQSLANKWTECKC